MLLLFSLDYIGYIISVWLAIIASRLICFDIRCFNTNVLYFRCRPIFYSLPFMRLLFYTLSTLLFAVTLFLSLQFFQSFGSKVHVYVEFSMKMSVDYDAKSNFAWPNNNYDFRATVEEKYEYYSFRLLLLIVCFFLCSREQTYPYNFNYNRREFYQFDELVLRVWFEWGNTANERHTSKQRWNRAEMWSGNHLRMVHVPTLAGNWCQNQIKY